jgi:diaphanous 1
MPDDILIVPTVLPSGSLHFASVQQHGTVADVINALSDLDEVKSEMLGDLHPRGWAIQLFRKESPGRQWEEAELESLGDGMLSLHVYPASHSLVRIPLQVLWTSRPELLP